MVNPDIITDHVGRVSAWLDTLGDTRRAFAVVYHGDCDGVISAALFDHILHLMPCRPTIRHVPVRTEQYDFEASLAQLENLLPDVTIFLDLSIQNHPEKLLRAAAATAGGILVYDHHSQFTDRVPERTLYLNPSITPTGYDEESPPPCFFAARLAQRRTGNDFDWAACIGLIAESAVEQFLPLFRKLPSQFPGLFPGNALDSARDVSASRLKEISYAIGSAFWAEPGAYEHRALRLLSEMILAGSPRLFFDPANQEAREIIALERRVRSEINRAYVEAEYNSYFAPEARLRYTEVQSEYRIGGVVATRLSRKHKDHIVVSGQHYAGRYVIEARRGANCHGNVVDLLKEATRDLPVLSLGGHPAAAGAGLPEEVSAQFFLTLEQAARKYLPE